MGQPEGPCRRAMSRRAHDCRAMDLRPTRAHCPDLVRWCGDGRMPPAFGLMLLERRIAQIILSVALAAILTHRLSPHSDRWAPTHQVERGKAGRKSTCAPAAGFKHLLDSSAAGSFPMNASLPFSSPSNGQRSAGGHRHSLPRQEEGLTLCGHIAPIVRDGSFGTQHCTPFLQRSPPGRPGGANR